MKTNTNNTSSRIIAHQSIKIMYAMLITHGSIIAFLINGGQLLMKSFERTNLWATQWSQTVLEDVP
jgi:hypothetical protein